MTPQPPIAVDDVLSAVVGVPFTFNYYANDSLFGLPPAPGSTFGPNSCFPEPLGPLSVNNTGLISGTPVAAGTCMLPYTVLTSAGTDSAVINVTVLAPPA